LGNPSVTPPPKVRIQRLHEAASMPVRATAGASGLDLCAVESARVDPGERVLVRTGLAIEIPVGFEGQVRPRSGLAARSGVTVLNAPGTIDSDYRGEVCVLLMNHGREPFAIRAGDRIAQLVVAPVARAELVEASQLGATERGSGGFGHSGA